MKVIISEGESYELNMPNEISFSDFDKLVDKLKVVVSMIKGEASPKKINVVPVKKYKREEVLYLMKTYYASRKDNPSFIEALNKLDITEQKLKASLSNWVRAYSVTPGEVGLQMFPRPFTKLES